MAGIRTAAVHIVATATLAALVASGGLGRYIVDGFAQHDDAQLMAGGFLVAVFAVLTEVTLGWLQARAAPGRRARPPILSRASHQPWSGGAVPG